MFTFLNYPVLEGDIIELRLARTLEAIEEKGYVPSYIYSIYEKESNSDVGYIDLRIGENENLFYGGHIGYHVYESYRGHGYAGKACLLLRSLALSHDMKMLRITCDPDNLASRRTIEKLGAKFLGVYEVPEYNEQFIMGHTHKCVFEWYIV